MKKIGEFILKRVDDFEFYSECHYCGFRVFYNDRVTVVDYDYSFGVLEEEEMDIGFARSVYKSLLESEEWQKCLGK